MNIPMDLVPMGTIVAFALDIKLKPPGWLLCDGSAIPSKYQKLISALNSDVTPNLAGRTLLGTGIPDMGPQSDSRNPNYDPSNNWPLGFTGGEYQHRLTEEEMPSHSHNIGGYKYRPSGNNSCDSGDDISAPDCSWWNDDKVTSVVGENAPHYNMMPYQAVNYIIYTGQND
ncbi:phage tail protein [Echinicola shivajiensis]|uniref:phage tail protein n=1 Tax=Echinicola shivajiensis TaxID=1035916 RepID=UPI001BFCC7E8|nr:tail fiber protein [Echinicola shivajiensis]